MKQFDYDASAPLNLQDAGQPDPAMLGVSLPAGVSLREVSYGAPAGPVGAYLVEPEGDGPFAVVLWVHMYPGSKQEFLPEALDLAQKGVVSLLVDGRYPWKTDPGDFPADRQAIAEQVLELRRGLDLLLARDDADPRRVAFVGHDYGAMHGAVLSGLDPRVKAYIFMTPTGSYADWRGYFASLALEKVQEYAQGSPTIDPITYVAHATPAQLLFQFAANDRYVSEEKAGALFAAASEPKEIKTYDAEHELDEAARADRDAFLQSMLGLQP